MSAKPVSDTVAPVVHRLTLVPGPPDASGRVFWEPCVDGRPLRTLLDHSDPEDWGRDAERLGPAGDYVPVLVQNWPATSGALELLGEATSDLPGGRVALYVCPVCADDGCGVVSVLIERSQGAVVWREFGWDVGGDDGEVIRFRGGPFVFDPAEHDRELRRFATAPGAAAGAAGARAAAAEAGRVWRRRPRRR